MAAADPLWLTRTHAALMVALSPRQFDEAVRPRLPEEASRGEGRTLRYHAPAVVATWYAYKLELLSERRGSGIGGKDTLGVDALIEDANAPDSPALERVRLARAIDLELDLEERLRSLLRREAVVTSLAPATAAMRGAGGRLVKRFGNEAGQIFNNAVDAFEQALERFIADASVEPGGGVGGEGPGAGPVGVNAGAAGPDVHGVR